ncbi:hypothetical protein [Bosea sp. RAC05]|jgi:hypothetical protein|uniref:hypothetical protein n=1 Tax=Bosea sp. RAC05 TaxID=1842539 RepID=UPI00083DEE70|nr:hypothetical protein [Bosea sp. RAC05]AOG04774.1 putative membrane protein [Bosea sp. RAC05]
MLAAVLGALAGMIAGGGLFFAGCYLAWRGQWFGVGDVVLDIAWNGWVFAVFFGGLFGNRVMHWLELVPA